MPWIRATQWPREQDRRGGEAPLYLEAAGLPSSMHKSKEEVMLLGEGGVKLGRSEKGDPVERTTEQARSSESCEMMKTFMTRA